MLAWGSVGEVPLMAAASPSRSLPSSAPGIQRAQVSSSIFTVWPAWDAMYAGLMPAIRAAVQYVWRVQ